MAQFKLLIASNPIPGKEDAYLEWYSNERNVAESLDIDGFVTAQRFRIHEETHQSAGPGWEPPSWRYVGFYDLDCNNPSDAIAAMGAATQAGNITLSDTLDIPSLRRMVLQPITQHLTK
jgi:hypothetical protein